jgi:translation initiation factor IF-3
MTRTASGKVILDDFAKQLSDVAIVDKPAKMEGRSMVMFLTEKRD